MNRTKFGTFIMTLLASLAATAGCTSASGARFEYTRLVMGVQAKISLYAADVSQARAAARAAFERMLAIEDVATDYRPDSELMRLCAAADGSPQPVSDELFTLLAAGQQIAEQTQGAFDPTVGPLVRLWREARRNSALPDADTLAGALARTGWRRVQLGQSPRTIAMPAGTQLDLGGIAKGYSVDAASRLLTARGVRRHLVALSGDLMAGAPPPGRDGWRIQVESGVPGDPPHVVALRHAALSTSGDRHQFVEIGGLRYAHIVDPRTGLGLSDAPAATVIAADGATADAWATACCVLGYDAARRFIGTRPDLDARVVARGGTPPRSFETAGYRQRRRDSITVR
ncbi:MAG: FAD:protein FMN transferase [Phycisphaerae bacterium]|nr:FAD:protein FMN transferase [Phycisphaerae bacterium]